MTIHPKAIAVGEVAAHCPKDRLASPKVATLHIEKLPLKIFFDKFLKMSSNAIHPVPGIVSSFPIYSIPDGSE